MYSLIRSIISRTHSWDFTFSSKPVNFLNFSLNCLKLGGTSKVSTFQVKQAPRILLYQSFCWKTFNKPSNYKLTLWSIAFSLSFASIVLLPLFTGSVINVNFLDVNLSYQLFICCLHDLAISFEIHSNFQKKLLWKKMKEFQQLFILICSKRFIVGQW